MLSIVTVEILCALPLAFGESRLLRLDFRLKLMPLRVQLTELIYTLLVLPVHLWRAALVLRIGGRVLVR